MYKKDFNKQEEKDYYHVLDEMKKKKFICVYNNCQEKAIKSHLISKYILKQNFDIGNKLISTFFRSINQPLGMGPRGITQEGITFEMFCKSHDTNLFQCVENDKNEIALWKNKEINSLNYRTVSFFIFHFNQYYDKERRLKKMEENSKVSLETPDMLEAKKIIANLKELRSQSFDNLGMNDNGICFAIFTLQYQNNVLGAVVLQHKDNHASTYVYLLSDKKKKESYFIISSYRHMNLKLFNYIKNTLNNFENEVDKQIFITNLILGHGEVGIYFNTIWWNNHPEIINLYKNSYSFVTERNKIYSNRTRNLGYNFWNR